jgi:hypothetical protein
MEYVSTPGRVGDEESGCRLLYVEGILALIDVTELSADMTVPL